MACPMILEHHAKEVIMDHVGCRLIKEAEPSEIKFENHMGREWISVTGVGLKKPYAEMLDTEVAYVAEGLVRKALKAFYHFYRFDVYAHCSRYHDGSVEIRCTLETVND